MSQKRKASEWVQLPRAGFLAWPAAAGEGGLKTLLHHIFTTALEQRPNISDSGFKTTCAEKEKVDVTNGSLGLYLQAEQPGVGHSPLWGQLSSSSQKVFLPQNTQMVVYQGKPQFPRWTVRGLTPDRFSQKL